MNVKVRSFRQCLNKYQIALGLVAISLFGDYSSAQLPPNPVPFDGGYQGTIRFLVFSAFGNNQHSTGACFIDGAFVALNGYIPPNAQQPYGEMAVLRSHPNYNEIVATLIAAKVAGATIGIQLVKDPSANAPLFPATGTPGGCASIPVVGSVYLVN